MKKPLPAKVLDTLNEEAIARIHQETDIPMEMLTQKENKVALSAMPEGPDPVSMLYVQLANSYLNYRLERETETGLLEQYDFAKKALGEKRSQQIIRKIEAVIDDTIASTLGRAR